MDETKTKTSAKQKIIEQKTGVNNNVIKKFQNSDFSKCLIKTFSFFKIKTRNFHVHCSILNQFIFYVLPISHLLGIGLVLIHTYIFDNILRFNYYNVIKEEVLRYLITDIDDVHFELTKNEINSQFEDIGNIMFFNIYFDELISLGLLNDEKIFPNISIISETFFKEVDEILKLDGAYSLFSIPSDFAKKYIDDRKDSLSELAKVYYYFYPLISFEAYSVQTYINQTYLIAYEIDDKKNMKGEEMYFNFPMPSDEFFENNNFHAYNNFISPKPSMSSDNLNELINNSYYTENWYFKEDSMFRKYSSQYFNLYMNFIHLNLVHEGNINKTNIIVLDSYYKNNLNRQFIIEIIYFINQKKLKLGSFDHSVFIITNMSRQYPNVKWSDNLTYVASQNDITEIALSSVVSEYFHYGLISNSYNFFNKGVFYDNININLMAETTKYYYTIKGFNFDIRYFSPFFLYTKLSQRSLSVNKTFSEGQNLYIYFFNESWHIKDICSEYNFTLYKMYLNNYKIDCFNKKNLLYYTKEYAQNLNEEESTLPYCICLPLYCIKNLNKNFDPDNIEYANEITLPEKCQNNLKYYENNIREKNLVKSIEVDTSNIILKKGQNLNELLEDQFIKFSYVKFKLLGGLSFMIISIVDNTSLKMILTNLLYKFRRIRIYFIGIMSIGLFLLIIGIYTMIITYIVRVSKSIYEYKKKLNNFIKALQNKKTKQTNKKDELNNNNAFDDFMINDKISPENIPLLETDSLENKFIKKNFLINEENALIKDLFSIYCNFYKLKEENFENNYNEVKKESKIEKKIKALIDNNELFKLFCLISLYAPRFKLDINIDFNIYKDSKLMNNYLKSISKKTNINKEQILYTKSILYELLSTELINNDYGFITNLNFNYLTNINLDNKNKNNPIQNAIFKQVDEAERKDIEKLYNDEDEDNPTIKLVWKYKNLIMKSIEEKFEQDDYLQLNKLQSAFNTTLINAFYNYSNKIIISKENNP